jgi:DNA invertase Pin-like site-specific DNA recombinase
LKEIIIGILGIYARTSIETEGTSIDQQKNFGIKFASKSGLEYQLYEDSGI